MQSYWDNGSIARIGEILLAREISVVLPTDRALVSSFKYGVVKGASLAGLGVCGSPMSSKNISAHCMYIARNSPDPSPPNCGTVDKLLVIIISTMRYFEVSFFKFNEKHPSRTRVKFVPVEISYLIVGYFSEHNDRLIYLESRTSDSGHIFSDN